MLTCAIKRTRGNTSLSNYRKKVVLINEVKFNGSYQHLQMRCNDVGLMIHYKPICNTFITNFDTFGLNKEKGFIWEDVKTNIHFMFKNTSYTQNITCNDSLPVWNFKELKELHDFYTFLNIRV